MKIAIGSRLFDGLNYLFLLLMVALTGLPFIYIIAGSFVSSEALLQQSLWRFPELFSWDAYRYIFSSDIILHSLWVSVFVTAVGTAINLALTSLLAYPLARKTMRGRKPLLFLVVFTMLFNGGMIPTYLVVKQVGILDSYLSLWLPVAISAFNLILLKNFFQELPDGIEESAKMDGCNDFMILLKIVVPLSLPALATFALFYAVGHWNSYFTAIIYLNDAHMWPIQVWLRQIVILSIGGFTDTAGAERFEAVVPPESIKLAVIVVATVPVLLVYPFLQKYFTKGILMGSVKG